jgi:hypothetical protein
MNTQEEIPQERVNLILEDIDNYVIRDFLNNNEVIEDKQNVHDTSVQNNLKNKYKEYNKDLNYSTNSVNIQREIMNYTRDPRVIEAIRQISRRNCSLTNFDDEKELKILENTWKSGNNLVKEQIIKELRDCIDSNGQLYCPTGVASRIVSAKYIEEPEKFPVDKNTLNTEILSKAYIIKKDNPEISKEELTEIITQDYSSVHDKEFIISVMSPWIDHL